MKDHYKSAHKAVRIKRRKHHPRTKLTVKQTLFLQEFRTNGGNGTQAALKAYDTTDRVTAGAIATENLQKPLIRQAYEEWKQEIELDARNAIVAGLRDSTDNYKRGTLGVQTMKGIGRFERDVAVNVGVSIPVRLEAEFTELGNVPRETLQLEQPQSSDTTELTAKYEPS